MANLRIALVAAAIAAMALSVRKASASATSFVEPAAWTVGAVDSTHQQWDSGVAAFLSADTPPTSVAASPSIGQAPSLGVALPGYTASSGGYYSHTAPYTTTATIVNHGGDFGVGGPYAPGAGTRVLVQTAATLYTDVNIGVLLEEVRILDANGASLPGGANADLVHSEELFVGDVETSFGTLPQQELLFEFWLPEFTGDFRVEIPVSIHSSFQHLRVDSLIEVGMVADADFNSDLSVNGADFLVWQRGHGMTPGTAGLADGDANSDQQVDGADLAAWQGQFGSTPSVARVVTVVPEPGTAALVAIALAVVAVRAGRMAWNSCGNCRSELQEAC